MNHTYTRQRQGRDFPPRNHLRNAELSVEGNYNNIDGIVGNAPPKDDAEAKTSMLDRLEHYKKVAERNAAPVDGNEPEQDCPPPDRGRDLS
jgi:hypothetical protein